MDKVLEVSRRRHFPDDGLVTGEELATLLSALRPEDATDFCEQLDAIGLHKEAQVRWADFLAWVFQRAPTPHILGDPGARERAQGQQPLAGDTALRSGDQRVEAVAREAASAAGETGLAARCSRSPRGSTQGWAAAMEPQAFLEFGFCGIDFSISPEVLREAFAPPEGAAAGSRLRLVAAFQLAYQGFPWQPTPEYEEDAPREARRYGGLVYPSWAEVAAIKKELPKGTPLSFHLNETPKCRYVSGLLQGDPDVLKLVGALAEQYGARHLQVNLTAMGVPPAFLTPSEPEGEAAIKVLKKLCTDYPDMVIVVPIAQLTTPDGTSIDTLAFFDRLLAAGPVPANLCAFFDCSAGTGKEPDRAPELPAGYPEGVQQRVGFTGGIHAGNVKTWLDRYKERAQQHGCSLLSDAQTGFRQDRKRGNPVDVKALLELAAAVREWAAEQPSPVSKA